ncbi:fibronectin-binding A domain-containing protein, putative [Babesia ovata]|uniref:Fibronectin-binding A domain-containing protein, putative n=1 Tax=Babesia ovata TaxID=189622 RepID=A0A2H6KHU3_9APIC|nr:fibronectin-binding A domain-containing protein, putative [Babesia ovata]GBE62567.1 fibronectin-binding A domain-containing protein, putative [Babesia ovata]
MSVLVITANIAAVRTGAMLSRGCRALTFVTSVSGRANPNIAVARRGISCPRARVSDSGSSDMNSFDQLPRYPATPDDCIASFDTIKNDEVVLQPSPTEKGGSNNVAVDFGMLRRYSEELNAVLANATFNGVTQIPLKKWFIEAKPLDVALLHFRGFERGDSLCLFYQRTGFPLVPSPSASYIPATERQLSYFETVMSGLSGLRVTKVHCPYFFKSILAIDLKPAYQPLGDDGGDGTAESYRIMFIARRSGNRFVMTDNKDGTILLTSETFDEKSGIKDGVGSVFQAEPSNKATPDPSESYGDFASHFMGKQHMSLLKAMILTYEGLDARRVTLLAAKSGVDCTKHVSKIENLADFHDTFIRWVRSADESHSQLHFVTGDGNVDNDNFDAQGESESDRGGTVINEPNQTEELEANNNKADPVDESSSKSENGAVAPKTIIEYVFRHWGSSGPVYAHQRLSEEAHTLIDTTLERLEKIRQQCIGDEQQVERLAKVNERINTINEYSQSLSTAMKWKSPEQYDLVKTIYDQVFDLGDLTGYRSKGRTARDGSKDDHSGGAYNDDEEAERNVPHARVKKVNPYKGILVIKTCVQDPNTPLIIVGRNAEQNERVTHELSLPGDIWLHTKDCPGSHVLLRRHGGSAEALQVAADIACHYSKAKARSKADVIKTGIENVTRCPGAKIGAVLVSNFETITGHPASGGEYVKAHRVSLN